MPRTLLAVVVMIGLALSGCVKQDSLKFTYDAEEGRQIFEVLFSDPSVKEVADKVAPVTLRIEIAKPNMCRKIMSCAITVSTPEELLDTVETFDYRYVNGNVSLATGGDPGFTLKTTQSVVLDALNADDGLRVFVCAMKDNAATVEATNLAYAASFNAAKGRLMGNTTDCVAKVGDEVTFRGMRGVLFTPDESDVLMARMNNEGSDYLQFDKYRAPIMWHAASNDFCKDAKAKGRTCDGAGYSQRSSQIAACSSAIKEAYAEAPADDAWQSGLKVSNSAKKAAELAACNLIFGRVN